MSEAMQPWRPRANTFGWYEAKWREERHLLAETKDNMKKAKRGRAPARRATLALAAVSEPTQVCQAESCPRIQI